MPLYVFWQKGLLKKTKNNILPSSHATILYLVILFLVFFSFNTDADAADRYWVGSAGGDWDNNANWAAASGACGTGPASYPVAGDTAIFDGSCTNNITLDVASAATNITNAGTYGGVFNTADNGITLTGNFQWDGGTFTAGNVTIQVGGDWDSSAGTFTYGTSTVALTGTGNLDATGDSFYNLTMAAAGQTTTLQSSIKVQNICTLGTGTLTGEYQLKIGYDEGKGGNRLVNGGATVTISRIFYHFFNQPTTTVAGGTYTLTNGLVILSESNNATFNLGANLTVNGTVTFGGWVASTGIIFNTQNNNITATGLIIGWGANDDGTVNLGSSTIDLGTSGLDMANNGGSYILNLGSASLTPSITSEGNWELVDGTGSITQNAYNSTVTFDGTGTQTITSNGQSFNNLTVTNNSNIVTFADAFTTANFTAQTASTQLTFTDSLTYTITGASGLTLNGQAAGTEVQLRSSNPGTRYTINVTGGAQSVSYVDVQDSNASGNDITASNSIDRLNNDSGSGTPQWVFGNVTRYWVGASDGEDWDDNNNWSSTSGGSGGADYPQAGDTAVFDGNDTSTITLDAAVTVGAITNTSGYTTTFDAAGYDVTVSGNFQWDGGTFDASTGTPTITVGGNWDSSAGTFTYGTSTVVLGTNGQTKTLDTPDDGLAEFYDLTIVAGATINAGTSFSLVSGGDLTINGTFDIQTGKTISDNYNGTITINSGGTLTGAGTFQEKQNSTTANTFDGTISVAEYVFIPRPGNNDNTYKDGRLLTAAVYGDGGTATNLTIIGSQDWTYEFCYLGGAAATFEVKGNLTIQHTSNGISITLSNTPNNKNIIVGGNLVLGHPSEVTRGARLLTGSGNTVDITGDVIIYNSSVSGYSEIDAGSSTWTVAGDWTNSDTFTANTSTVTFNGSGTQSITSGGDAFNNLTVTNSSNIVTFADAFTAANFTAQTASTQLTFTDSLTYTITGASGLNLNGQAAGTELQLRSATPGTRYTINVTGGAQTVSYVDVQDSNASGNDITANNSIDRLNNDSGEGTPQWVFGAVTRYWVGGAGGCGNTWADTDCWSATSGGTGGADYPQAGDAAIFDSSDTNSITLGAAVAAASITNVSGSAYTGTFATSDNAVTLSGSFQWEGGTFNAGASTISVGGSWKSDNGTFTAGTSTIDMTGDGDFTGPSSYWLAANKFNNINMAAATYITTVQSAIDINDTLTLGTGEIAGAAIVRLGKASAVASGLVNNGATITLTRFLYNPSAGTALIAGGDYGTTNIWFFGAATMNFADNITTTGVVQLRGGMTVNTQDYNLTATGLRMGGLNNDNTTATFNLGNSTITLGTSGLMIGNDANERFINLQTATVYCAGDWNAVFDTGNGKWTTITPGTTSEVIFNGTTQQTITSNGNQTYNDFTLNNTGSGGTNDYIRINGDLDVNGTLTITNGQLRLSNYNPDVNTAGAVTIGNDGSITKGTGTWTFDGTTTYTDSSTGGPQDLGTVVVD